MNKSSKQEFEIDKLRDQNDTHGRQTKVLQADQPTKGWIVGWTDSSSSQLKRKGET